MVVRCCLPEIVAVIDAGEESSAETEVNSVVEEGVLTITSNKFLPSNFTFTVVGAVSSGESLCCRVIKRSLTSPPNRRAPNVSHGDEFVGTEGMSRSTANKAA